jgi:hypothetical protein
LEYVGIIARADHQLDTVIKGSSAPEEEEKYNEHIQKCWSV